MTPQSPNDILDHPFSPQEQIAWESYLRGDLPASEMKTMNKRLLEEASLAETLIQFAEEEAILRQWADSYQKTIAIDENQAASDPAADLKLSHDVQDILKPNWTRRYLNPMLMAAAIVLLASMAVLFIAKDPKQKQPPYLSMMNDVTWSESQQSWSLNQTVFNGQRIAIEKGKLELTYPSGVKLKLFGPCQIESLNPDICHLIRGKVSAQVQPGAEGYTIRTKTMDIIDLGTRFGVTTQPDNATEVHVFEGEVDVRTSRTSTEPRETYRLSASQAALFNDRGQLKHWLAPAPKNFDALLQTPGITNTSGAVRWLANIQQLTQALSPETLSSQSSIFLIPEKQNVRLTSDLRVTFDGSGRGTRSGYRDNTKIIKAGTEVDSYLLHYAPSAHPKTLGGSVTFKGEIIGIIARDTHLGASDAVFSPDLSFPTLPGRGLDEHKNLKEGGNNGDVLNFRGMPFKFSVHLTESTYMDQIRVIVKSE